MDAFNNENENTDDGYLEHYIESFRSLIEDSDTIEICVNADNKIFVERSGDEHMVLEKNIQLEEDFVTRLVRQFQNNNKSMVDKKQPLISGDVKVMNRDIRYQIVRPPATFENPIMSLRLYNQSSMSWDKIKPLYGSLDNKNDPKHSAIQTMKKCLKENDIKGFLQVAVNARLNILLSGATSSGKTTLSKLITELIDINERLILIEDAREIRPKHPNKIELLSEKNNPDSLRTAVMLLEATLRLRPDRIIMGEIRGDEALTYLESINTGHGGSFTTIHAESTTLAKQRLAFMVLRSKIDLNMQEVMEYITNSIDVIIQTGRIGARRGITDIEIIEK